MKETGKGKRLEDRLLGDEWADWQPGSKESDCEAPKSLFLVFSSLFILFLLLAIALFWYLILPRISEFGIPAVRAAGVIFYALAALLFVWYFVQVLSSTFKIKLIPAAIARRFSLLIFLSAVANIGKLCGISRDKMGNSFVKFHNDLMYATKIGKGAKRFLLLLPRCLSAETRKAINTMADKYQFKAFTAFGGDEARKIIKDQRPDAVIGVACERDLISGIHDTAPKIPVFGLVNRRPEGPCKNTYIDIQELERIVRYCSSAPSGK